MSEVEQGAGGIVEGRGAIVLLDGAGEAGVVGCGTQILCVSFRSVVAPLGREKPLTLRVRDQEDAFLRPPRGADSCFLP